MKHLSLLILLLLSGCALFQPPPPPASPEIIARWQANKTRLNTLNTWRINGSISVTRNKENWVARVLWDQQGSNYKLRLNAPLGQGAALLSGDDNGVELRTANNQTFNAPDADALIAKVIKLEIPVNGLHFWIRGLPVPQIAQVSHKLTKTGHLYNLQQNGWHIEYGPYAKVQGFELPRKIYLDNNKFQVKIVISKWAIGNLI